MGIRGARQIDSPPPPEAESFLKAMHDNAPEELKGIFGGKHWHSEPELLHAAAGGNHVPLPWGRESTGTHRLFALIGPLLEHLKAGHTVCVDELEVSMHPIMVCELLRLFFSNKENTSGAQIIFTTHNPLLLDPTLIRRDQVWFTDKDDEGRAHLYPLSNYDPRVGES